MKKRIVFSVITSIILIGCTSPNTEESTTEPEVVITNKGQQIIIDMTEKVGDYQALLNKKDVVYTYLYQTPDGKKDIIEEQYIFHGELSKGTYKVHERSFKEFSGTIEQGYDGSEYWLKHNDTLLLDEENLKRVRFNRPTNFYWFAMLQKLLDPGLIYEYKGEVTSKENTYDIVKITFESTSEKPTDTYQLYVNQETKLVDKFLFTVVDYGVEEIPFLMKLEYEDVDGILIPSTRKYKKSTWTAEENDAEWVNVKWSNIKFNNSLTVSDFKK